MSDELKPRATIDSPEFVDLMQKWALSPSCDLVQKRYDTIIAHIDAWGARIAGDAADVIEGALVDDVLPYHSPEWIARARTTLEKLKSSKD